MERGAFPILKTKKHHSWYGRWWGVFLIVALIIVVSFLLAFAFYIKKISKDLTAQNQAELLKQQMAASKPIIEGLGQYSLGSSTAPITIVEFCDFACPYCRNSYQALRDIAELNKSKVRVLWRDFVGHADSISLSLAARCAGEQNKFWEMHDGLFSRQGILGADGVEKLAQQNNLNIKQFNDCLKSEKYRANILKDQADAEKLQIKGTPTWFINGYLLEGELSSEQWQNIIDQLSK